jgi:hypothetical protein
VVAKDWLSGLRSSRRHPYDRFYVGLMVVRRFVGIGAFVKVVAPDAKALIISMRGSA